MSTNKFVQKSKPKVSVCMITYGHEKYIREAIEGVLMQDCDFEVELILANDCSPDGTDQIVKELIENHPRGSWIKYFAHEQNLGIMPNFSFALEKCKGEYVALCEGDDYWIDAKKLIKQVEFLDNHEEFKFCITNLDFFSQVTGRFTGSILDTASKPLRMNIDDFLINKAYMAPCTWLGHRECFFYTDFNDVHSDATFAIFMDVLQRTKVHFISDSTTVYRILPESASNSDSLEVKYSYHKGLYKIQQRYIEKYNLYHLVDRVNEKHLSTLVRLLTERTENNVNSQKDSILAAFEQDLDSKDFIKMMRELVIIYQNKIDKLQSSKSMQIGRIFTVPILNFKKIFIRD